MFFTELLEYFYSTRHCLTPCVGGDPVAGLAVVVALLDPLLDEVTPAERVGVILQSILL